MITWNRKLSNFVPMTAAPMELQLPSTGLQSRVIAVPLSCLEVATRLGKIPELPQQRSSMQKCLAMYQGCVYQQTQHTVVDNARQWTNLIDAGLVACIRQKASQE